MVHGDKRALHVSGFLLAIAIALPTSTAEAQTGTRLWHGLKAAAKTLHREKPETCKDDSVEQLASEIDWLEHHIDTYGSIVAKQPDVWGQSRLTRHRYEYESQMKAQLGNFQDLNNASISRSDQSFVGMAMAMSQGSGGATPQSTTNVQNMISDPTNPSSGVIDRTAPFTTGTQQPFASYGLSDNNAVSLEPSIHLDHLSQYIGHLDELRRINEGDDTVDSPGYALNLVRIPISILPGKSTQQGHGAEVTVIGEAQLGDDLLPITYRSMVINDLIDLLAPGLTFAVNNGEVRTALCMTALAQDVNAFEARILPNGRLVPGGEALDPVRDDQRRQLVAKVRKAMRSHTISVSVPTAKMRRARMPLPPEELVDVVGEVQVAMMLRATFEALGANPANRPCIEYNDVRGFLGEELQAAYDFLSQPRQSAVWEEMPGWNLAELIRSHRMGEVELRRRAFFESLGLDDAAPLTQAATEPCLGCVCRGTCENDVGPCRICRTTTAVLAWTILVESALLNERLIEDMRNISASKGFAGNCGFAGPYYGPNPPPEARDSFNDYVRRRWPIRIFALDPVSDEQNVEEMFSQRREMQLALAMSVAHGKSNRQTMSRYDRALQTNMATIGLNQTAVGFTHGADTFGWRFYPRVQAPPTQNNLTAFRDTLIGTNSRKQDLSQRCLEPGMRECTAMIVMPSFVPYVTFDIRTNWFSLTNPKSTDQSMRQAVKLSRSVKSMQQSAAMCAQNAGAYRDGEVARLMRRVDQLDRELPLQTMIAQIPYENTSGGFELFNTGVTDLAPELVGYYGAEGVNPNGTTVVFLVGKGFNLHDTSVIAGGKSVPITIISRQVLRAEIPSGVQTIRVPSKGPTAPATTARRARHTQRLVAQRSSTGVMLVSGTERIPTPAGAPQNPLRDEDPSGGNGPSGGKSPSGSEGPSGGRDPSGSKSPSGGNGPSGSKSPSGGRDPSGSKSPSGSNGPSGGKSPSGGRDPSGSKSPSGSNGPSGGKSPSGGRDPSGSKSPSGSNGPSGGRDPSGSKSPSGGDSSSGSKSSSGGKAPSGSSDRSEKGDGSDSATPSDSDDNSPSANDNEPRSVLPRKSLQFPLPAPAPAPAPAICSDDDPCAECCDVEQYVDIHMATPYGVSDHLFIPIYDPGQASAQPIACDLAFAPGASLAMTTTKTKSGAWKINEYYQGSSDRIAIDAPTSFAAPQGAELRCTLRDEETGNTIATFSVPTPAFQSASHDYVFTGADLRNFIGDTSRPATDKTLRGAIKPYIDHLATTQNEGGLPNVACNLNLTAELATGQQVIPVTGSIAIQIRRADQVAADDDATP